MKIIAKSSFKIGKKTYKKGEHIPEWPPTANLIKWQQAGFVSVENEGATEKVDPPHPAAGGGGARTDTQSGKDSNDGRTTTPTK